MVLVTQAEADELVHWDKAERNSKALLLQKVPDSVAILINSMVNISTMWMHVKDTYTTKGTYVQTNLHSEFLQSKCFTGGNVRELTSLCITRI